MWVTNSISYIHGGFGESNWNGNINYKKLFKVNEGF